jgi:DNA-binding transcriptional MerR regulator
MEQLTMGDILRFVKELKDGGMSLSEIYKLPVYLGDDDELNGIHCGWYTNLINADNTKDEDFIELINENRCNIKLETGKAILIS